MVSNSFTQSGGAINIGGALDITQKSGALTIGGSLVLFVAAGVPVDGLGIQAHFLGGGEGIVNGEFGAVALVDGTVFHQLRRGLPTAVEGGAVGGDPGPHTSLGVFLGIKAAVRRALGRDAIRIAGRQFIVRGRVWEHDGLSPALRLLLSDGGAESDTAFGALDGGAAEDRHRLLLDAIRGKLTLFVRRDEQDNSRAGGGVQLPATDPRGAVEGEVY